MRYHNIFLFSLAAVLLTSFKTFAQSQDESYKVYDDTQVGRIEVTVDPAAIQYMYSNIQSDSEFVAKIRFKNWYIDETIDSVGFRLRGNTSRESNKKSFKISFNSFKKGRKFYDIEKLNLNGEHNDPSIIRSKLCFDHFRAIGLNASRAAHTEVYINGIYYGLYMSIEHIDENFIRRHFKDNSGNLWKCLYPADLTYLGDNNPEVYRNLSNNGTPVYDLSTNQSTGNFNEFAHLIIIINKTPAIDFADSLETIIDIPEVLKYLSMNILLGSWDSYWMLRNNYYLYHEPVKGLFHIIPYDYDNTFGIEWGNANWSKVDPYNPPKVAGGTMPLAENLIANAQYRNLYTHFLEFYRDNVFKLSLWEGHIDSLLSKIKSSAMNDNYRTLDWGFTSGDFFNSYSANSYSNQHVKFGLKQYVNLRNSSLSSQLSYVSSKPVIYKFDYYPKDPVASDSVYIVLSVFSPKILREASVKLFKGDDTVATSYPLKFSPVTGTKKVEEADRFVCVIPPLENASTEKFYVVLKDENNLVQTYPRQGKISISTPSETSTDKVVINEFLADNLNSETDPSGDHEDWVELYNPTSSKVLMTGKFLTDDPLKLSKWKFTKDSLYLAPAEYMVIWLDEQQSQPGLHANFKLSKSGEFLALIDSDSTTIIDSLSFGRQLTDQSFGRYPDGSDRWNQLKPTPGVKNALLTAVEIKKHIPLEYNIKAYPNPFNPRTSIEFQIPKDGFVSIKVYDMLGKEIATLVDEEKSAGSYRLFFDGKNLSSGIYFLRLSTKDNTKTIKLQLLR